MTTPDPSSSEPFAFGNLGAIERIPDPRDHLIGAATGGYTFPAVGRRKDGWDLPIFYQGKKPACGAHAGAWYKMLLDTRDGLPTPKGTPRFPWINIKRDGTSPSEGTTMDKIFKSLRTYGIDTFDPLGNDVTKSDENYASVKALTDSMLKRARARKIDSYAYPQDLTFKGIKQTIDDFGACILLIQVCELFWTSKATGLPSWKEEDILPLYWPGGKYPVISGHFVVAHDYDEKYIYFANSFSDRWGRKGHGYFGQGYMPWVLEKGVMHNPSKPVSAADLVDQVKEIVPEVEKLPAEQQGPFLAWIKRIIESITSLRI